MKLKTIAIIISIILLTKVGIFINHKTNAYSVTQQPHSESTSAVSVKTINSTITADGSVTAQNMAVLHFQTAGKLIYLPFKEGDLISSNQTIARLDSYPLQRQLELALNSYRSTRDTFDQVQQNSHDGQLQANMQPLTASAKLDKSNAIDDAAKRIIDENQANLDNSIINVELANYALQFSTLTSPIDGLIIHEDVTVPGVNITPAASFVIADPATYVFRANVPADQIYYIEQGSTAEITIDGSPKKFSGTITKIYPSKTKLTSGEEVYMVDIQSEELIRLAKFDQAGTAIIKTNSKNVMLAPAWTVLNGKYIWVNNSGKPELKTVIVAGTHDGNIEITTGLTTKDKVITDPEFISRQKYQLL